MSDGHLCTRWFERRLGCPFDGESWHTFSYNPDENFHFDEYPPEDKKEEGKRSPDDPFDYDEWLESNGLRSTSIAFTKMGYHVYGSLLLQQQQALKPKTTSGANLNVAPFTSTGAYLAMVEAAEMAVADRVGKAGTQQGLAAKQTSSTQRRGLSVGSTASVIIWATAVAAVFAVTKGGPKGTGSAGLAIAVRTMPPEVLAWVANLTKSGQTSPGILGETLALATAAVGWLSQTRDMAPLPERLQRNVYNQNAWADPGLG